MKSKKEKVSQIQEKTEKAKVKVSPNGAKTMADLLASREYKIPSFKYGDIVEGTVVSLSRNEILLDVGAKAEGLISGRELEDNPNLWKTLKLGDKMSAFVIQSENDQGYLVLSLRRALPDKRWKELEEIYDKDEPLSVRVTDLTKGGLIVDSGGVSGFVPLSHLTRDHLTKIQTETGDLSEKIKSMFKENINVKIIEMDKVQNRLVLSEKEVISAQEKEERTNFLKGLKIGQEIIGTVTGVMPFGLFVEIGNENVSIEGMVHLSEMSYEKVGRPSDLYKVGDGVSVRVIEVDPELNKVALSIKATQVNPWDGADKRYPVGSVVEGEVAKIVPFGAFVRLERGVDALIHVTETTGPLKVGEKVKAVVLDVTPAEQRLALSLKKMKAKETAESAESNKGKK